MFGRHVVDLETVEFVHEGPEGSSCFLAIPMQEPGVGLANNQIRRAPAWPRQAKQSYGLRMPLVVAVQERNEDSRFQKNRFSLGSARP